MVDIDDLTGIAIIEEGQGHKSSTINLNIFSLDITGGSFSTPEIIVLLGQNGCGKTTFINYIYGKIKGCISRIWCFNKNTNNKI